MSSLGTIGPKLPPVDDSEPDGATYGNDMRLLMRMLQVLIQPNVISMALSAPPASPANGATYIVGASPSGAWAGQANNFAFWTLDDPNVPTGKWEFYVPLEGWLVGNQADGNVYKFTGSAWETFGTGSGTVTEVDTGTGLTGGPITHTGTVSIAALSPSPAGVYTNADITVNAEGQVIDAADGSAGSDFSTPNSGFFFGAGITNPIGIAAGAENPVSLALTLYVFGFTLESDWTLTTASFITGNSGASLYIGAGIYDKNRNALIRTSWLSTAIAGIVGTNTFAPVTLAAGEYYYFAEAVDNTSLVMPTFAGPEYNGFDTQTLMWTLLNANAQTLYGTAANPMGTNNGVMPATLGAITPFTTENPAVIAVKWTP